MRRKDEKSRRIGVLFAKMNDEGVSFLSQGASKIMNNWQAFDTFIIRKYQQI